MAVLGVSVCVALAFSSCKSSESAYKKRMKMQRNRNWLKRPHRKLLQSKRLLQ